MGAPLDWYHSDYSLIDFHLNHPQRYKALAAAETDTLFRGRLGTCKYYNMDQCIAQALTLAERLPRGG